MHNPYSPPSATVRDIAPIKGSGIKAVTIGVLVDMVCSTLAGIPLVIIYAVDLARSGMSGDDLMKALENIPPDSWVMVVGAVIGCLFSVLGGYLCARIAKHSEYKFGLIVSGILVLFGLLIGASMYSLLMNLVFSLLTLGSVMAGTQLGVSKNRAA